MGFSKKSATTCASSSRRSRYSSWPRPPLAGGRVNLSPKGMDTFRGAVGERGRLPRPHRQRQRDRGPPSRERPGDADVLLVRRQAADPPALRQRRGGAPRRRPLRLARSPLPRDRRHPADHRDRSRLGADLLRLRGAQDGAGRRAADPRRVRREKGARRRWPNTASGRTGSASTGCPPASRTDAFQAGAGSSCTT